MRQSSGRLGGQREDVRLALDRLGIPGELFKGWVLPMKAACYYCPRPLSSASWYYQKRTLRSPEMFAHRKCRTEHHKGHILARCFECPDVKWYTPSAYGNLEWVATVDGKYFRYCRPCAGKRRMELLQPRRVKGVIARVSREAAGT